MPIMPCNLNRYQLPTPEDDVPPPTEGDAPAT